MSDTARAARFAVADATDPALWHKARAALHDDPDPRVRAAALGAVVRAATAAARTVDDTTEHALELWRSTTADPDRTVRRRAAELAPSVPHVVPGPLLELLTDPDPLVAEAAAWALGEVAWEPPGANEVVRALATATVTHGDPLVREAAVAALGALGDPAGVDAVLSACRDRPAIRRRAVLALAPFEGPAVEAALAEALADPDWQVRQAAEDLRSAGDP